MRFIAFCICLLAPMPALALSCVRPSVERSYGEAATATEPFMIVKGTVTFDESLLPKADEEKQTSPKRTDIPARIKGHALSRSGFVTEFDQPINYAVGCVVVWCGSGKSGEEIVAFVEETEKGFVLDIGPCGGRAFPATKENTDIIEACMESGTCQG